MKKTLLLISSALLLLNTSCATIVSGSKQKIEIYSTPTNSTVYIDNKEVGKTPYNTKLKKNQSYTLKITSEGYDTYKTDFERSFNAWYIGNIGLGGIIGLIVDPITGAIHKLKPVQYNRTPAKDTVIKANHRTIFMNISLKEQDKPQQ